MTMTHHSRNRHR